jgi:hypothetical protein
MAGDGIDLVKRILIIGSKGMLQVFSFRIICEYE